MGAKMGMSDIIFDKYINVSFQTESDIGQGGFNEVQNYDNIITPDFGRKPQIAVEGSLFSNSNISGLTLKVTNFYTSKPLSQYKTVSIKAGYKNNMYSVFSGEIWASYVDKPPPDNETVFEIKIGYYQSYINGSNETSLIYNKNFAKNTSIDTMLKDIADFWGGKIKTTISVEYFPKTLEATCQATLTPNDFNFQNLSLSNAIKKIQDAYEDIITIRVESDTIYVNDANEGTKEVKQISYITTARNNCGTFTITGPWLPTIRPGDTIQADPKYFKQKIGGQFINTDTFLVLTLDFSFDTCGNENQMILNCIPTGQAL